MPAATRSLVSLHVICLYFVDWAQLSNKKYIQDDNNRGFINPSGLIIEGVEMWKS